MVLGHGVGKRRKGDDELMVRREGIGGKAFLNNLPLLYIEADDAESEDPAPQCTRLESRGVGGSP